jgi:hypothetical protein
MLSSPERNGATVHPKDFESQKALVACAERNGLVIPMGSDARICEAAAAALALARLRQSSAATIGGSIRDCGCTHLPKFEANAPLREALAIKRERLRAKRATRERQT